MLDSQFNKPSYQILQTEKPLHTKKTYLRSDKPKLKENLKAEPYNVLLICAVVVVEFCATMSAANAQKGA